MFSLAVKWEMRIDKRHAKWECLKDGATISELVAGMKKKGLSSPRTFIVNCQKMGHLQIS